VKLLPMVVLLLSVWGAAPIRAQESRTLTVFAAVSLADAFEQIGADFMTATPGVEVVFSFASSSDLAAQLVAGAPADVFASANEAQMIAVIEGGRIADVPQVFAHNRLLLIVPADNPAGITSLADLAHDGVQLIIAAPDVPVRTYTDALLERLAQDPAYGAAYREAFMANVVSEEQNVRQVTAKIALGEGDAGIVYVSDVTPDIRERVIAVPIADELNTTASYPIAITNDTPHPALAQAFVDYVLSEAGQAALLEWGFVSILPPAFPPPEATESAAAGCGGVSGLAVGAARRL
jgi:molybdate transport system substrate-binding protein